MLTLLWRTVLIYLALFLTMRLMGKRQIGELEVTDLVTTLLLSEIASLPITETDIPISHAIIPMGILLFLEISFSLILIHFPKLRFLVSARPTVIIQKGELDQSALRNLRISIDELISEIRQLGYTSLAQIDCAILEKNGKLTVLPKAAYELPNALQLGVVGEQSELMHIVYCNRTISKAGLSLIQKNKDWLDRELQKQNRSYSDLFCVMANAAGEIYCIPKQQKEDS